MNKSSTLHQSSENDPRPIINDLHPIELAAHSLLTGPLDTLGDNFESLNQSQIILLTRLRVMESRLKNFKQLVESNDIGEKHLVSQFTKIKELSDRLSKSLKQLDKIDSRVSRMNE
ncbi:hypothetical protein CANMA_001234 [Candida margitis]|uniref:uncharacterized protein n=1 Tax=Candida margitis TaxID=1775924 RepID=UPI002226BEFC|nr:uncharacterized protein CANMA_001234 [Candida margitis]KAI5969772.1 hypothetical protein CANMA_001234 [Candida margitis]